MVRQSRTMNFELDDDQQMIERSIERFVGDGAGGVRDTSPCSATVASARWAQLADLGLLSLPLSAARGGLGGRPEDLVVSSQALGKNLARDPWLETAHFPLRLLEGIAGTEALSEEIASGTTRVAVAFAEAAGRYSLSPRDVGTQGRGDGLTVSGAKTFVLGGAVADLLLVTAASEDGPCLVAVDRAAADVRSYRVMDGSEAVVVTFRNSAGRLLGPLEPALTTAVAETRLAAAAEMVGLASLLFEKTLDYTRERKQFGRPLAAFQALQHRLVDCFTMLEQARSLLWRVTLSERDIDGRWMASIAGAKAFIAERAMHIGHEAIQLHGGMGMSEELPVSHAHRRIVLLAHLFGDPNSDYSTMLAA